MDILSTQLAKSKNLVFFLVFFTKSMFLTGFAEYPLLSLPYIWLIIVSESNERFLKFGLQTGQFN